MDDEFD